MGQCNRPEWIVHLGGYLFKVGNSAGAGICSVFHCFTLVLDQNMRFLRVVETKLLIKVDEHQQIRKRIKYGYYGYRKNALPVII